MKKIVLLSLMTIVLLVACNNGKVSSVEGVEEDSLPVKYENDLFSMSLPKGWVVDDSGWKGLDSMQNEMDFYNPQDDVVWFHFVKTYFPIQWKDIKEATEFAKTARLLSTDSVTLIDEMDSATIYGYPASVLMFANFVNNDTIIQKQFVTYIEKSHIVMYLNENFLYRNWDRGQMMGDWLLRNVVIKEVENPLDKLFNEAEDE
jgi:hypothetical protein